MENKGYLIYEVGIFGGNDKGEIKFILFLLFYKKLPKIEKNGIMNINENR